MKNWFDSKRKVRLWLYLGYLDIEDGNYTIRTNFVGHSALNNLIYLF